MTRAASSRAASSRAEIDRALARALRLIRRAAASPRHHILRTPTRPLGPASYRHLTIGQLATTAFSGLVINRRLGQEWPDAFFRDELQRRNLTEAHTAWIDDSVVVSDDPLGQFETRLTQLDTVTFYSLETLCDALNEVVFGDDGKVSGAPSPAEVLEDMKATGMEQTAIDAYSTGVGASEVSLSEELAVQEELPTPLVTAEPAAEQLETTSDHTL